MAPRSVPRAHPRRAKGDQGTPTEPQRRPKRAPSAAKRRPSAAQGRPREPKIFEKRPPGPNRWKSDSNGSPKESTFAKKSENQSKSLYNGQFFL